MLFNISFSLAIKFVTFSDKMTVEIIGLQTNFSMSITQLLVSIEGMTSKWTAQVVKQLKNNPDSFSVELFTDT